MITFTIPLEPRTKKNSGMILHLGNKCPACKRGMKAFMLPSKLYTQYEKDCKKFMPKIPTINRPVNIKCIFYKGSLRKCDLNGLHQAIDDILVVHKIIADDNFTIVTGHDGSRVKYDKENPRTEIYITELNEND